MMKEKNKEALRELLENVKDHEEVSDFSAVSVDLKALKRLLRWSQDKAYVWFKGDRVKRTDTRTPFGWLKEGHEGIVLEDSTDEGTVMVEWDNAPDEYRKTMMYHNEIKLVKS